MMHKTMRFGLAAVALCLANPALASDFSGIGRIAMWGFTALAVLVTVPVVLIRRKGRAGDPAGNIILSAFAGMNLAPAVAFREPDQWVFTPFPGAALAMAEGSWAVLFPVPMISMLACSLGLFWLLQRGTAERDEAGDDA